MSNSQWIGCGGKMSDFEQELYEARFGRKMSYKTAESLRNKGDFSTQIDEFVVDTERKLLAVMRSALTDLTNEANTDKFDGGRLPKDTGFLQHSAGAAINARPIGEVRGDKKQSYTYNVSQVIAVLANLKIGDTFYFGWTAEYARLQEARNGFLEGALMNWQTYVNKAVSKIK